MEKKKKNTGLIILIIILILIIGGLTTYILADKGIIKIPGVDIGEKKKKKKPEKEVGKDINIDNAAIKELYSFVHKRDYIGIIDEKVYNNTKFTIDDMDNTYKLSLAANLFDFSFEGNYAIVKEDNVKNSFERVFGPGTYSHFEKLDFGCPVFEYDSNLKAYKGLQECGGTTSFANYYALISAKKYSDRIELIEDVLFYEGGIIYKDYNKTQELRTLAEEEQANTVDSSIYDRIFLPYLSSNADKLQQYKYTFNLADDGFYYYNKVERIQE